MSESFIIAMTPMPDLDNYTKEDSIKGNFECCNTNIWNKRSCFLISEHVIGSVGRVGDFVKVKVTWNCWAQPFQSVLIFAFNQQD